MNLQLHHVVTDVTGGTGMTIIRAIIAGERNPDTLASLHDRRCRASVETISKALVGNDREEHVFALTQAVELYDTYQAKVVGCDARIEAILKRLQKAASTPVSKPPPARSTKQQSNGLEFDVRGALHGLLGCDLTQIHGLGPYLALKLVGECGTILSLANIQALHLLALSGTEQQNLGRQSVVGTHPAIRQPGRGAAATFGYVLQEATCTWMMFLRKAAKSR